jgi:hypothetical protein
MLSFASHQLSERQVWALGRLASPVVGLDLAERRDALLGSTLSGAECELHDTPASQCPTPAGVTARFVQNRTLSRLGQERGANIP